MEISPRLAITLNALALYAISAVLAVAFYWQFAYGELPCPLCMLQRAAFSALAVGPVLAIRHGPKPQHYGLTILAANPNVAIAQLSKVEQVRFDVRKFQWLGSSGADGVMFSVRSDLPYKSFDDLKRADKEIVAGTTGPGSNAHDFPLLLKEFAGLKVKLVSGYPANSDVLLAVERKEVDSWSALGTTIKLAADRGVVRPLVRGRTPVPGFENLPVDEELATTPLGKSLMAIKSLPLAIGRAFAAAPGTPADRVAMLRDAFAKAIKDPELLAEGKKAKIAMQLISHEQVQKDFNALLNQTPETLKEMGKYIKAE